MDVYDLIEHNRDSLIQDLEEHTAIYIGLAVVCMAIAATGFGLGVAIYEGSVQLEKTYEGLQTSASFRSVEGGGVEASFSDACYTCSTGPTYDSNAQYKGQDTRMTFKGQMKLTEEQRAKLQFPNGIIISDMFSARFKNTRSNSKQSYMAPRAFGSGRGMFMAAGARISTWNQFGTPPTSPFSMVPGTMEIGPDGTTGACSSSDKKPYLGGPIYGAYNGSFTMAACSCALIDGSTVEICMGMTDPAPS
jgi:hypothetical protein